MEPIEGIYFNWLCAKTLSQEKHNHNYYALLEFLHRTEYVWLIPGDRNRAEDGCELRYYFLTESGMEKDHNWYDSPCSLLEVLVAFANRASFQTDTPTRDWFWQFLAHLKLDEYRHVSTSDIPVMEEIVDRFMYRKFDYNGEGGILPVNNPTRDQRKIELWWQFCDYVYDRNLI